MNIKTHCAQVALIVCDLFNIEDHDVCDGAIHNYGPQLEYILENRRLTGQHACAIGILPNFFMIRQGLQHP